MAATAGALAPSIVFLLLLFTFGRLEVGSCTDEPECTNEENCLEFEAEGMPEEESALMQSAVRHRAVKNPSVAAAQGKQTPFDMGIPEAVTEGAQDVVDTMNGAINSTEEVSKAFDNVIKNVTTFSESTKAAADEIAAVGSMPVKKAEIVSEVTRKINEVEEQTMVVVGSFAAVAQALLESSKFLLGIAKNSTVTLASAFQELEKDLMKVAQSYANLLIMLSNAANVSFVQAHVQEEPAICDLVRDTFKATDTQLDDHFLVLVNLIESNTQNVTSLVKEMPEQISSKLLALMSKAQEVAVKLRETVPPAIEKLQAAVVNALVPKVCPSLKSSGFQLLPQLWGVALSSVIMLALSTRS